MGAARDARAHIACYTTLFTSQTPQDKREKRNTPRRVPLFPQAWKGYFGSGPNLDKVNYFWINLTSECLRRMLVKVYDSLGSHEC